MRNPCDNRSSICSECGRSSRQSPEGATPCAGGSSTPNLFEYPNAGGRRGQFVVAHVLRVAITELTGIPKAPTTHAAAREKCTGVKSARSNLNYLVSNVYVTRDGWCLVVPHIRGVPVAKLPVAPGAPATNPTTLKQGARMGPTARQVNCRGPQIHHSGRLGCLILANRKHVSMPELT